eukprot:jgi/Chrpa1/22246/Chrysochromulina_OHIO_Genome00005927-RA
MCVFSFVAITSVGGASSAPTSANSHSLSHLPSHSSTSQASYAAMSHADHSCAPQSAAVPSSGSSIACQSVSSVVSPTGELATQAPARALGTTRASPPESNRTCTLVRPAVGMGELVMDAETLMAAVCSASM